MRKKKMVSSVSQLYPSDNLLKFQDAVIRQSREAVNSIIEKIKIRISSTNDIIEKISICNKYIKIFEQDLATPPYPEWNTGTIKKSLPIDFLVPTPNQLLNWLKIELKFWKLEKKLKINTARAEIKPKEKPTHFTNSLNPKIIFHSPGKLLLLFNGLKNYFSERDPDFKNALEGNLVIPCLHFPHNQNKLVEVFRRAKYNGFILSTHTEIRDWICANFTFRYKRGAFEETKKFNRSTVWDILAKGKNEPPKHKRICVDIIGLIYKSKDQLLKSRLSEQR